MTRDMELIRKIFAEIQSREDVNPRTLEIPGVDEAILARHLEMLFDAGLIEGLRSDPYNQLFPTIMVKDLSWEGHNLAAAVMNESVWAQIKKTLSPSELKTLPLAVLKEIAMGLLTQWAKSKVGLSGS